MARMDRHTLADWRRLGLAVRRARTQAGLRDTKSWADAVGRSSRTLLGLERGEAVGTDTLIRIEETLGWVPGRATDLLDGTPVVAQQPTVTGADDVEVAILADTTLTERDKRIMLDLRRSMQAAAEAGHSPGTQGRSRRKAAD